MSQSYCYTNTKDLRTICYSGNAFAAALDIFQSCRASMGKDYAVLLVRIYPDGSMHYDEQQTQILIRKAARLLASSLPELPLYRVSETIFGWVSEDRQLLARVYRELYRSSPQVEVRTGTQQKIYEAARADLSATLIHSPKAAEVLAVNKAYAKGMADQSSSQPMRSRSAA